MTYGIGANGQCATPFTWQVETTSVNFTILAAAAAAASVGPTPDAQPKTTTATFASVVTPTATSVVDSPSASSLTSSATSYRSGSEPALLVAVLCLTALALTTVAA